MAAAGGAATGEAPKGSKGCAAAVGAAVDSGSMRARFLPKGSKKVLWVALLMLTGPNGSPGGALCALLTDWEPKGSLPRGVAAGLLMSKLSRSTMGAAIVCNLFIIIIIILLYTIYH